MRKEIPPNRPTGSGHSEPPMDSAIDRKLTESKMDVADAVSKRHLIGGSYPSSGESLKNREVTHIDSKNKLAKPISSAMSDRSQQLGFHTMIGNKGKTH